MPAPHPIDTALAFVRAINDHSSDRLAELMTDDHVFIDALGHQFRGRDAMRQAWAGFFRLVPGYEIDCADVLARGEVVALFGTAGGNPGRSEEFDPERSWQIPAAWRAVVRGGRIAEWRVYCDTERMRQSMEGMTG